MRSLSKALNAVVHGGHGGPHGLVIRSNGLRAIRHIKMLAVLIALTLSPFQHLIAAFHLWAISEVYSSPDGSVQFILLTNGFAFEAQLGNHVITCAGPQGTNTFTFPTNLPSTATANKSFLIGTANLSAIPG